MERRKRRWNPRARKKEEAKGRKRRQEKAGGRVGKEKGQWTRIQRMVGSCFFITFYVPHPGVGKWKATQWKQNVFLWEEWIRNKSHEIDQKVVLVCLTGESQQNKGACLSLTWQRQRWRRTDSNKALQRYQLRDLGVGSCQFVLWNLSDFRKERKDEKLLKAKEREEEEKRQKEKQERKEKRRRENEAIDSYEDWMRKKVQSSDVPCSKLVKLRIWHKITMTRITHTRTLVNFRSEIEQTSI